jgi:phage N-6-adenine-methyltransferase
MTVITDVASLYREESKLAADCRKAAEKANLPKLLTALYEARISLGEWCDQGAKQAERDGVQWADWCSKHAPFGQPQADKYRRVYHARGLVLDTAPSLPYSLDEAVRQLPTQAEAKRLAYATGGRAKERGRDSDDWQTPTVFIEAARRVMGSIDFDPYSSDEANERVRAGEIYTVDEDADNTPWPLERISTVWMNPPYGRGSVDRAVKAFLEHLEGLDAAIVLVNNASDTAWFRALGDACDVLLLTYGRIQFELPGVPDKVKSSNTRGQAFFYFGPDRALFCKEFREFGKCYFAEDCTHG